MLFGQQRGGHQHSDLFAVGHRDKGRAQRHLGLAKAHVAAHQTIHWLAAGEIVERGLDGGGLIGRFLERKALGEGLVVVVLQAKGVALAQRALGVNVEQFGGGVVRLFGGFLFRFFPLFATQAVQRRIFRRRAAVAADQMQARHRHIEFVATRVFEGEELRVAFA